MTTDLTANHPGHIFIAPHLMKSMVRQRSLLDPDFLRQWALVEAVHRHGITLVGQLEPRESLEHPISAPPNHHAVPTLVLGLSGITRVVARTRFALRPGELLLIEPGVWHQHGDHGPGDASLGIGFFGGRCDVYFSSLGSYSWGWVPEDPYLSIVHRLMFAHDNSERAIITDAIFASLIREHIYAVDFRSAAAFRMAACLWTRSYEAAHHVDELVQQSGTTRSIVFRLFRDVFGRTPKQEVLANRVSVAHHLLQRGMSVAEAAQRTGFTRYSDLTRAYRRIHGHPPTRTDNRQPTR